MPIQFEEVTGQIDAPSSPGASASTPPPASEDLDARLERALALQAERAARLNDA